MPGLSSIKALIEALRGGNWQGTNRAMDATLSQRSTYNPQGIPYVNGAPVTSAPTSSGYGMSSGLKDPAYLDYVKSTKSPMAYNEWLEKGG